MGSEETQTIIISVDSPVGAEEIPITIHQIDANYLVTSSSSREGRLRGIINNLAKRPSTQKVMIDLYRYLVLGNFTSLNGKRGKAAKEFLDKLYPEQGTLPKFDIQSMPNASGMIVHNIRKNANNDSYKILGGILYELLKSGLLDKPKLR